MVTPGIIELLKTPPPRLKDRRLALLCNQSSTDAGFIHSRDLVDNHLPGRLTCLFSPQHGFFAEKQDNMVESAHSTDPVTGLPVFSLYGEHRRPAADMLDQFDILLVDLPDAGTRVYTFLYTLAYCLEAAKAADKQVILCDRPNPIGGLAVEGNLLREECVSFVGLYPLPMRHGLTLGELALLINDRFAVGADLTVIPMAGWRRNMLFADTGLPWLFPSPNLPTPASTLVYPGQVLWEGTNVSEGRGTTLPFELFGAPYFEPERIRARAEALADLPGCLLRPLLFEPVAGKWAGCCCPGFQLHVTDSRKFKPYRTSLALIQAMLQLYPGDFQYKNPPYEYEYQRLPMDLLLGDPVLRRAIEHGERLAELEAAWQPELDDFNTLRRRYFLYQ